MQITHLTELAVLKIDGVDAASFLQGQLTNDVDSLESNWQYSGYCNPKGRLLALFTVWHDQENYYLLVPTDLVEAIVKRLTMFILRSKVSIESIDNINIYGAGDRADLDLFENGLADLFINRKINSVITGRTISVLSLENRYLIITDKQIDVPYSNNSDKWYSANIEQGIPQVYASSTELFIPQMLNLDTLGGISFSKGCYTGQEIVARLHYKGKVKQRMFIFDIAGDASPAKPGDEIYLDKELTQAVGNVVDYYTGLDKLLGVVRIDHSDEPLFVNEGCTLKKV